MYSTDLEETPWQVIKKILNMQERKRKYDLRERWNAIFYVVKTGCQWRMLPSGFAPAAHSSLNPLFTTILHSSALYLVFYPYLCTSK